jgi:hypothetical protein
MDYIAENGRLKRKDACDGDSARLPAVAEELTLPQSLRNGAVYKASQMKESAVDILDGSTIRFDDSLYSESIKKSQQRTLLILKQSTKS